MSLDSSKLTGQLACLPTRLSQTYLYPVNDGNTLGQSSLDSSKLTDTTHVLAYSYFTGYLYPTTIFSLIKEKRVPRPILNREIMHILTLFILKFTFHSLLPKMPSIILLKVLIGTSRKASPPTKKLLLKVNFTKSLRISSIYRWMI